VLIDVTNPLVETSPKLVLADPGDMSASEVVAALVPGARIVGGVDPSPAKARKDAFLAVSEAFDNTQRELQDYARRLRQE